MPPFFEDADMILYQGDVISVKDKKQSVVTYFSIFCHGDTLVEMHWFCKKVLFINGGTNDMHFSCK